ncbi:MAG: ABC transporter substrate-binding protein, partial [Dehalococcoidia bacterium]|nr:ABC transporter substrate-binding protein [Dehalococcoidia bacterium]
MQKVCVVGVILATACAPTAPQQPTGGAAQGEGEVRRSANQVLNIGTGAPPATLSIVGAGGNIPIYSLQFDSLMRFDKDFNILPGVAERWTLQPDNSWRLNLRRDMTFGNGDRMTANDVVFSINNLLLQRQLTGNTAGGQLLFVTGARAVDEFTVDIQMRQRDFSFLYVAPLMFVASQRAVEAAGGPNEFGIRPLGGGTGPYEFVENRQADGVTWRLRQNFTHPYRRAIATEIRLRVIPEPGQRVTGLRTGDLDIALGVTGTDLAEAAQRDGIAVNTAQDTYTSILFDQRGIAGTPMADVRVRLAMNYAVDKQAIARTLYRGFGVPIGQLSVPGTPNFNPNLQVVPFDQNRARQLLAEAGYPNGFEANGLQFPQGDPVSTALFQAIQDYHRQIGIRYELQPLEFATYVAVALGQRPRSHLISAGGANPNGIFTFSWQFLRCDNPNPGAVLYCVQAMDDLLRQAYQEENLQARNQLLQRAGAAWVAEWPQIFLIATPSFVMTARNIRGLERTTPSF